MGACGACRAYGPHGAYGGPKGMRRGCPDPTPGNFQGVAQDQRPPHQEQPGIEATHTESNEPSTRPNRTVLSRYCLPVR